MRSLMIVAVGVIVLFAMAGCSKKVSPSKTASVTRLDENVPAAKPVVKKVKIPTPQVIVVNDSVAKRNPEGRFYYDLNGKRYWKSKKDGKYYIYKKRMFESGEF